MSSRFGGVRPLAAVGLVLLTASFALPQECKAPSFPTSVTENAGADTWEMAIGEFTKDALSDIAVVDRGGDAVSILEVSDFGLRFLLSLTLPASTGVRDVAVADFNHDGWDDVAVSGESSGNVLVRLGNAVGDFGGIQTFKVENGPTAIVTADFNVDGKRDIAVANTASGTVSVLLGDGAGDFSILSSFNMSVDDDMAAADVDMDGVPDLISVLSSGDRFFVALGRGDGTFSTPNGFSTGAVPVSLLVEDFNRDGIFDVLTLDNGDQGVSVHRGDGTGGFSLLGTYRLGGGDYRRVAAGDVNGDGILDVVSPDFNAPEVSVILGRGDGSFDDPVPFASTDRGYGVLVADFNRDGRDNVAISLPAQGLVELLRNGFGFPCPAPSFGRVGRFLPSGNTPGAVAIVDGNLDFSLDAAVASNSDNRFDVLRGDGTGRLFPDLSDTWSAPVSVARGDVTFDGHDDLVVANQGSNRIAVYVASAGGLSIPVEYNVPGSPVHVAVGDLSFDGKGDIAALLATGSIAVLLNDGLGSFTGPLTYLAGANPTSIAIGDLDNDFYAEIAVGDAGNAVFVLSNAGNGTFTSAGPRSVTGQVRAVDVVDLNGDGNRDLVAATGGSPATARLEVLAGNGDLTFTPGTSVLTNGTAPSPHALAIDDFDANGRPDVAVVAAEVHRVVVLLGNGGGGFAPPRTVVTGEPASAVASGDLDRDGRPDLVIAQPNLQGIWAVYGDGSGGFAPDFYRAAGNDSRAVAHGDFDKDGTLDLVVADAGSDAISFFRGQGGGRFANPTSFSAGKTPVWISAGDFDNKGQLDLVVSSAGTNEIVFLPGNGNGTFGSEIPSPTDGAGALLMNRAADFDLDGDLDITVIVGTTVEVHENDGSGQFSHRATLTLGGLGSGLVLGDFDRNGRIDIAATQLNDHNLIRFMAPPAGTFTWGPGMGVALLLEPRDPDVTDFNGDGYLDFIVPATGNGRVYLVLSNGPGSYDPATFHSAGGDPVSVRAADWNRDGKPDFVVAFQSEHSLGFYMGDGAGNVVARPEYLPVLHRPSFLDVADFDSDSLADVAVVPLTNGGVGDAGVSVLLNTNCKSRLLFLETEVSSCDTPGSPFTTQPLLRVRDDGQNPIYCEPDPFVASFVPGTGGGASLLGTTSVDSPDGADTVTYTNLAVSAGGIGSQLQYQHTKARRFLSRTFSQAPTVTINGPTAICEGDAALYQVAPQYDTYLWSLDSVLLSSMTPTVDLTGALAPGLRGLSANVGVDGCTAGNLLNIDVTANLSAVVASPPGPVSVCMSCTGPLASVALTGGGASTFQWGYRIASGGSITPFAGETGSTYSIEGADFPGPGTYFLVATVTPACGASLISSEIEVDVTAVTSVDPLVVLSARATDTEVLLEWATPPFGGCTSVRVLRRDDGTFPLDPNDTSTNFWVGGADFPCPGSGKDAFSDVLVTNDTRYHYAGYVLSGGQFSARKTITSRPFDSTTGNVRWAYSTAAASMGLAGLRIQPGTSSLYIVSNDGLVHGLDATGQWLAPAKPYLLGAPSQVRPPAVSFAVGSGVSEGANGAVFVSSQNGSVYTLDADELDEVWVAPVADMLQGSAAASFGVFGGQNLVLVGTRNPGANGLQAVDVDDGSNVWFFENLSGQGGDGNPVGIVLSGPSVDYDNDRVYFGSWKAPSGTASVWAIDVTTNPPQLVWAQDLGDVEASPVYVNLPPGPQRLIVASKNGDVHLLDAADGSPLWTAPYNASDGGVKGFVFPQFHGPVESYMFSTVNKAVSIRHNGVGTAPSLNWEVTSIPFPSTPLFLPGTNVALVGSSNGRLYQLVGVDGASPTVTSIVLGDGGAGVGAPGFDVIQQRIVVGTEEGVIYAIDYPLP